MIHYREGIRYSGSEWPFVLRLINRPSDSDLNELRVGDIFLFAAKSPSDGDNYFIALVGKNECIPYSVCRLPSQCVQVLYEEGK